MMPVCVRSDVFNRSKLSVLMFVSIIGLVNICFIVVLMIVLEMFVSEVVDLSVFLFFFACVLILFPLFPSPACS